MAESDIGIIPTKDAVVNEAQKRFKICQRWEANSRNLFLEDIRFAEADSDNMYQWPNEVRRNRDVDERPCLTINKIRQHNLQIINDAKKNKPGIAIRPTGNGATTESAEVFENMIRHIEYISNATTAYDTASSFQVRAGIGFLRVVTEYADNDTFDQDIFIRRVDDPLTIYIDPDAKEADKSDMRFAFVFDDVPRDQFDYKYPQYKDELFLGDALGEGAEWVTDDHIRVAEYYRKKETKDKLVVVQTADGTQRQFKLSELPKGAFRDEILADPNTRTRKINQTEIEWFKIVGFKVVEKRVWPGKYIPIIPVIGEETIIDGLMDRKGHTRAMKDPQRIYNYWSSSAVEHVALQGKTPWVASAEAIEGYETYWNTANNVNHSVLAYNGLRDDGKEIPMPQRPNPPVMAPAYISGMQVAGQELMMVSGQYQPQMGEPSNERSGKAIQERQRQGDTATYHYIDNLAVSIRFLGRILLDLIPKIYDTQRLILVQAENGVTMEIMIDPSQKMSFVQQQQQTAEAVKRIFNPNVGKYDVEADIGPAYATKREEAFNAFTQIITQAPQLMGLIGDIVFRAADFPHADEVAERLRRMIPPQALGLGPTPNEQMLQQQVQQMRQLLGNAIQELGTVNLKMKGKEEQRDIDVYDAETDRIKTLIKDLNPEELRPIVEQLVVDSLKTTLDPILKANAGTLSASATGGEGGKNGLDFSKMLQGSPNANANGQ